MIRVALTNEMLEKITSINEYRLKVGMITLPPALKSRFRTNSTKKRAYSSNKIEGNPLTEDQISLYADCYTAYIELDTEYKKTINAIQKMGAEKHSDKEASQIIADSKSGLENLMNPVKETTTRLAEAISYQNRLKWTVYEPGWYADQDINEVNVDFR